MSRISKNDTDCFMDRYNEMRAFATLAECNSFAAAAIKLDISRGGMTRLINDLEQRLGVRLINRTTRSMSLTAEGELFYARCRVLLKDIIEAETEMLERNQRAAGTLHITAPMSFGQRYLNILWPKFIKNYPEVQLEVHLSDQHIDIVEHNVDIAFRIGNLADSSLISRQIGTVTMKLCASPEYLKKCSPLVEPKDLLNHSTIAYSHWYEEDEWHFSRGGKNFTAKTTPVLRVNSSETVLSACLGGLGVALSPDFLCNESIKKGLLVEVMPNYKSQQLGIHLVYPSRKYLAPKLKAMLDFLGNEFATPKW